MSRNVHFTPVDAGRPHLWTATALAWGATSLDALAHLGLRTGSRTVADALALSATDGRFTADSLRHARWDRAVLSPASFASLALFWSATRRADDHEAGAAAYSWLLETDQLPGTTVHHQAAAQALFLAERRTELNHVLAKLSRIPHATRNYLEADLAHPAWSGSGTDAWLSHLSKFFVRHGLARLGLREQASVEQDIPLFDQLTASAPSSATGQLVTVVIPCWRPDEGLVTSVRSISEQSHRNLEIVIVDDASGPEYAEMFDKALSLDPRARLVRLSQNQGSYVARQAGIDDSRGDFITTQDADDWSHPERIARQVSALIENPHAPGSRSLAVRARDDLTHQWFGYSPIRWNASSLLLRRGIIDRAGPFLPIRKSADSEFAERLETLLGPIVNVRMPLAVTRLRSGSLSRGDFTYQWAHPDRMAFRGMYRAWHRQLVSAPSAQEDVLPSLEVPPSFSRGISTTPRSLDHVEHCLIADFSNPPGEADQGLMATVAELHEAGSSIGLWHTERPRADRLNRREMHADWFDYIFSTPRVHSITRTQSVEVTHLAVMDPEILLLATGMPTDVRPREVVVALHERNLEPGPHGLPLDIMESMEAVRKWWRQARWVYAPYADAAAVAAGVPHLSIGTYQHWAGILAACDSDEHGWRRGPMGGGSSHRVH